MRKYGKRKNFAKNCNENAASGGNAGTRPTLHDDVRRGVDGVHVVGGEAGVLAAVGLLHVLDVQPSGRGDVDAGVAGQRRAVPFGPGDPGLRLARGAAFQGHALSHQHLRVLGLDDKTGPRWREGAWEKGGIKWGVEVTGLGGGGGGESESEALQKESGAF